MPTPDPFTEVLIDRMEANGFQVTQGYPVLYTIEDCIHYTYPALKNCFGANPAAPYVIPVVKLWPDEYLDPAQVDSIMDTNPGYTTMYRLDPREAVVIYGLMPPPGRYMGLQTWQFSEHARWKTKDYNQWADEPDLAFPMQYLFDTLPPDDPKSQRVISLTSLGDVVNNAVMESKSGYPFGEIRYFIITPSAATDEAIRHMLQDQGVADGHIFTEEIPGWDDYGPIGPLRMGKMPLTSSPRFGTPFPIPATNLMHMPGEQTLRSRCCACAPPPPWVLPDATPCWSMSRARGRGIAKLIWPETRITLLQRCAKRSPVKQTSQPQTARCRRRRQRICRS